MKAISACRQSILFYNSKIDPNKSEAITDLGEFMPFPHVWKLFTDDRLLSRKAAQEFTLSIPYLPKAIKDGLEDEIQYIPLIVDM